MAKRDLRSPALHASTRRMDSCTIFMQASTHRHGPSKDPDGQTKDLDRQMQAKRALADGSPSKRATRQCWRARASSSTPPHALRVFGRLGQPSRNSAAAIQKALARRDRRLSDAAYAAALSFALHCKQKVEFVRRVFTSLPGMRDQLEGCWNREIGLDPQSINPPELSYIRDAIVEVTNLMTAYDEFAVRAVASTQA